MTARPAVARVLTSFKRTGLTAKSMLTISKIKIPSRILSQNLKDSCHISNSWHPLTSWNSFARKIWNDDKPGDDRLSRIPRPYPQLSVHCSPKVRSQPMMPELKLVQQ
jgi:hypothetical protein